MDAIIIEVAEGKYTNAKDARRDGQIPMIYYAKGIESKQFTVEYQSFRKAYKKAGRSTIITLVDEKKEEFPVLVQEVQYHPITDDIAHVDLKAILKGQKLNTEVPLVFVGDAPAVRELGGTLISSKNTVSIECLPKDLPHEIEVDISSMVDFSVSLTVGDIKVPNGVTILDDESVTIATMSAPRTEEVVNTAPVAAVTEVIKEKKVEEGGAKAK